MAMNVSLVLQANAAQAKAELASTTAELRKVGTAATALDQEARGAASGTKSLEAALAAARGDIQAMQTALAALEAQNASYATSLSTATGRIAALEAALAKANNTQRGAAGAVGNMTAQWNDVIMMMAAGQNPIQLAIQQGTQITQNFGAGGAAGALSLVKQGFMAMISPMNLLTIGAIAVGAAFTQWLMSAGEEVKSLEDAVADLEQAVTDLRDAGGTSLEDLRDRFGEITPEVLALQREVQSLRLEEVLLRSQAAAAALKGELNSWTTGTLQSVAELLDRPAGRGARGGFVADPVVAGFGRDLDTLIDSESFTDQIAAVERLQGAIRGARDASKGYTDEQRAALINLNEIETQLRGALALQKGLAGAAAEANREMEADTAALRAEAEIRALIARYGEDSLQVTTARVQAERDALLATLETNDASAENKANLIAAWDAANGVATVDMAGNITLAADEASRLARNLELVEGIKRDQERNSAIIYDPRDPRYDPDRAAIGPMADEKDRGLTKADVAAREAKKGGKRSEVDQVQKLIDAKRKELDLMRTSDPVQRELIRNREALAKATAGQRAELEQLIGKLEEESAAQDLRDGMNDWLSDVARNAETAGDAIDMLKEKLIDAAYEALIMGQGPLAGLFGTTGSDIGSMVLGFLGGGGGGGGTGSFGLPLPFADGGMIYGLGGPRDDRQMIAGSPGEFMVNARATAANRALLEFLNAGGSLPRFANGGLIGGQAGSYAAGFGAGPMISMPVSIDARGSERGVGDEVAEALRRMMPEIERRAVAAVAQAQRQGRL